MVVVDIAQLETLTDILVESASDAEETLNRLNSVSAEILDDQELFLYTQADVIRESIVLAKQALNRGTNTLLSLKSAIIPAAEKYLENEKNNEEALSRMVSYIDSLNNSFNAAIVSDSVPQVEHTDSNASQDKVQQLVMDSMTEMQSTNIAAVTKAIKEEYEVKTVKPLEIEA